MSDLCGKINVADQGFPNRNLQDRKDKKNEND
jgi:hypothetical protein